MITYTQTVRKEVGTGSQDGDDDTVEHGRKGKTDEQEVLEQPRALL